MCSCGYSSAYCILYKVLFSGLANYCCCILCTVCLECNEIHHQGFEHENVVWLTMHIIPICFVDCAIMKSSKFWAGGKMRNAIIRNLTCTTVKSSMINICLLCVLCWCVKDMWQVSVPFPPLFFLPFPLYYINCNHLSWPFKHELNTIVLCMYACRTHLECILQMCKLLKYPHSINSSNFPFKGEGQFPHQYSIH